MAVDIRLSDSAATDDDVERVGRLNPHLRVERATTGELIVSPPAGGWAGKCGAQLLFQLETWNRDGHYGVVFDASTGFRLPDGALFSPDLAMVEQTRIDAIPLDAQMRWLPLCPDVIVEIRSPSDNLDALSAKVARFRQNGTAAAILFDPLGRVELHDGRGTTSYDRPETLEVSIIGQNRLPLVLQLAELYRRA